ncbi:MAG: metallophosphoesterase family protein [Lentisphaerota bacterium]
MRYGIISDIHSNIEALTAVYERLLEYNCDKIISLGDVVGYGASPSECIDFVRQHDILSLKGNHDAYTVDASEGKDWDVQEYVRQSVLWTRTMLSQDQTGWLRELPYTVKLNNLQFVHASMETMDGEYWPYVLDQKTALFHFYLQETDIAFCGHIHIPLLFTYRKGGIVMEMLKEKELREPDVKYLVNPGAVGQPRDSDWRGAAAVYDSDTRKVIPVRVEYDVAATQDKIRQAGLPAVLAERLSRGC